MTSHPAWARDLARRSPRTGAITDSTWSNVYTAASIAGTGIGAYHGYKRNDSIGWAIAWGLLGGLFPVIVIPVAFAQGIGERK